MTSGSDAFHSLLNRIASCEAVIGIVGMGYVGQPLALRCSEKGFGVIGFDVDADKVARLNDGVSTIEHIDEALIAAANHRGMRCTTDFAAIAQCDAVLICVPTPLNKYREPDLRFVTDTCEAIAPYLRPGQLVSLESTTYPGTTDEEVAPRITSSGLVVGETVFLIYSPEREDPGNVAFTTHTIPKVVGGATAKCLEVGKALYGQIIDRIVPVSSTKTAEMTKLLENIHRAVNIGLVNEMKIVCDAMDIDIFEVIEAASTKPFGFTAYFPGPGLGGHCIPIDPFYLTWKAREFQLHTRFIELAGEINQAMPRYVFDKLVLGLNAEGRAVRGSKVLVLGIAYKKNVDDMRESPAVAIMELLRDHGAELAYSDPHVPRFPKMREHRFDLSSVALTPDTLARFDAAIVATDHDAFDYAMIAEHASLIIDSRGVYRDPAANVIKA
ncbi:MAG: nucleotide sugar dehydrogenase [Qipengyuania sp.]|nr:nucleotide sugar dehydrogenase [Qipengyuania sp.]